MKRVALIAAVVFTALTIQSCRESDNMLSPEEAVTLQRVQDSSDASAVKSKTDSIKVSDGSNSTSNLDIEVEGEIVPPPKK